jgi:preprotein translocase subunit SecA
VRTVLDERGRGEAGLLALYTDLAHLLPLPERTSAPESWRKKSADDIARQVLADVLPALDAQLDKMGDAARDAVKLVLLDALDDRFSHHLEELAVMREGIGWQSIAEKDPKIQFALHADEAWTAAMADTRDVIARAVLGGLPPVTLS